MAAASRRKYLQQIRVQYTNAWTASVEDVLKPRYWIVGSTTGLLGQEMSQNILATKKGTERSHDPDTVEYTRLVVGE